MLKKGLNFHLAIQGISNKHVTNIFGWTFYDQKPAAPQVSTKK